ncbi:hypothetical protein RF11_08004 [Thelohanellus kitauei]|uniref:Uncharacterized protein n=1 Tax=Thelohanellus kitauei TaxID=669202 RepID=A0A0C2IIK4_THEKT|nr:hypothetical protein RF11_08004 [Thelohanellus kitauei]
MTKLYIERHDRVVEIIASFARETHPGALMSVDEIIPTFGEYVGHNRPDILIVSHEIKTIWIVDVAVTTDNLIDEVRNIKIQRNLHFANNLKRAWKYLNVGVIPVVFRHLASIDSDTRDLALVVRQPLRVARYCQKAIFNFATKILACFGCGGVQRSSTRCINVQSHTNHHPALQVNEVSRVANWPIDSSQAPVVREIGNALEHGSSVLSPHNLLSPKTAVVEQPSPMMTQASGSKKRKGPQKAKQVG